VDFWKLVDRFKEPSSWASLAAGLGMLGVSLPSSVVQGASLIGAGACMLLGFFLKEKTNA
jgi:hypothetical protein